MLYIILKYIAQLCFSIYHRKVYKLDAHNQPKDGPVLLNCNHPGAFLDACLISAFSDRPLYYLTRGDMFKKGIANWFLTATHQIPIFRADHGIGQMRQNRDTFATCYEYLNEGRIILIFPEAKAAVEKKLRPLYKGAARITYGTYDNFETLPAIVPVGFTFFEPRYFGYDAFYCYGPPIDPSVHLELYKEDPQAGYAALTDDIRRGLREAMIYLETDEGEEVFNALIPLIEEPPPGFPPVSHGKDVFNWQSGIAEKINAMSDEELATLKDELNGMRRTLRKAGISWDAYPWLADGRPGFIGLLLSAPFTLLGNILGWIPMKLSYVLFIRKVKRDAFIGPIKGMLGFFMYAIFLAVIGIVLSLWIGWWGWLIAFGAAMIIYFSLKQMRKPHLIEWIRFKGLDRATRLDLNSRRGSLRKRFPIK